MSRMELDRPFYVPGDTISGNIVACAPTDGPFNVLLELRLYEVFYRSYSAHHTEDLVVGRNGNQSVILEQQTLPSGIVTGGPHQAVALPFVIHLSDRLEPSISILRPRSYSFAIFYRLEARLLSGHSSEAVPITWATLCVIRPQSPISPPGVSYLSFFPLATAPRANNLSSPCPMSPMSGVHVTGHLDRMAYNAGDQVALALSIVNQSSKKLKDIKVRLNLAFSVRHHVATTQVYIYSNIQKQKLPLKIAPGETANENIVFTLPTKAPSSTAARLFNIYYEIVVILPNKAPYRAVFAVTAPPPDAQALSSLDTLGKQVYSNAIVKTESVSGFLLSGRMGLFANMFQND
ncbi:hypothetical protein H696_03728 [Fonticula alba]|uniref:Arrestin C-terminal-like domain-containing protein n=1 Tax=Fonticula alba TaxID=691883 RepID=A0A058Z6Y1_FONAL|nr:hypothetical protein H696_03728 [Fonticula alba]KCV69292.1 hypothetical protein H696_03728 [Fonticula alba]|eukprot:XP_009495857.1 hypothetical protein H696_03728 [Fonticula alba]